MQKDDIRAALMAGNFDTARNLGLEISILVQEELRAAPDPQVRQHIYKGAIAQLTDALSLARVLRAHLASQLEDNSTRLRYQAEPPDQHRWQFIA